MITASVIPQGIFTLKTHSAYVVLPLLSWYSGVENMNVFHAIQVSVVELKIYQNFVPETAVTSRISNVYCPVSRFIFQASKNPSSSALTETERLFWLALKLVVGL